jgi:hypothetical protein
MRFKIGFVRGKKAFSLPRCQPLRGKESKGEIAENKGNLKILGFHWAKFALFALGSFFGRFYECNKHSHKQLRLIRYPKGRRKLV